MKHNWLNALLGFALAATALGGTSPATLRWVAESLGITIGIIGIWGILTSPECTKNRSMSPG